MRWKTIKKKDIPDYSQIQKKSERTSLLCGVMRYAIAIVYRIFFGVSFFFVLHEPLIRYMVLKSFDFFLFPRLVDSGRKIKMCYWISWILRSHYLLGNSNFCCWNIDLSPTKCFCLLVNIDEYAKYPITEYNVARVMSFMWRF